VLNTPRADQREAETMSDQPERLKSAVALFQAGEHGAAKALCRSLFHGSTEIAGAAYQLAGLIENAAGDAEAAKDHLRRAVIVTPAGRAARINLAAVEEGLDKPADWARRHRLLAIIDPTLALAWHATSLHARGENQIAAARAANRRALLLEPGTPRYLERRADLTRDRTQEVSRFLRHACVADPGSIALVEKAARHFGARNDHESALAILTAALGVKESPRLRTAAGYTLRRLWRNPEAADHFRRALAAAPETGDALLGLMWCRRQECDWDGDLALLSHVHDLFLDAGLASAQPAFTLAWSADPNVQLMAARATADAHFASIPAPVRQARAARGGAGRIRLGYLSPHFGEHPVGRCIIEVLERHDRTQFEVFAYATRDHGTHEIHRRARDCVEHFRSLAQATEEEIHDRIVADGIEILVDLDGYSQGHPGVIAQRPAPVLVNFLGFPGTSGGLHDYLVNDHVTIAPGTDSAYAEHIVWMPHCYLPVPAEGRRADPPNRAEEGLPEDRLVLGAFHTAYKITPEAFEAWCAILRAVPDAVLWLLDGPAPHGANLRAAARRRGVAVDRLIFARFRPDHADHLARLPLADLFLDTFPHTAHSTAAELMSRACPLVTRTGDAFASRVAASVLRAAGAADLITEDWNSFVAKAVDLCAAPGALETLRKQLRAAHATAPLFDRDRYVRALETGYREIAARHRAGKPPASIEIAE
jgi:protein O-GlcNAc transferase